MQLKVIKADGSIEQYLHTKIIGTISNALAAVDHVDICAAEYLAEVVTYFLYHEKKCHSVKASEILSIVKAVLSAGNYEDAAEALMEHHFQRRLKRCRIEVVSVDIQHMADAQAFAQNQQSHSKERWDKSVIIKELVTSGGINRQTARTIASMVEEKILNMGLTQVPASLIKQLVLNDAAAMLQAHQQLQTT